MNRSFSLPLVIGASGRLAIDGNHFSCRQATYRTHPAQKALLELFWVKTSEHSPKGVMTRDTLWQRQKGFQPVVCRLPVSFNADQPSAPQMTARIAIVKISMSK